MIETVIPNIQRDDHMPSAGECAYVSGDVEMRLNPAGTGEAYFRTERDVVSIQYAVNRCIYAYDSDKVRPYEVACNSLAFHPAGTSIYVRWSSTDHFLSLAVSKALTNRLLDELDLDRQSLHNLNGVPTTNSMQLGGMARSFLKAQNSGGQLAADSLSTLIMLEAVQAVTDTTLCISGQTSSPYDPRIQRVIDYIHTHLEQDLSLTQLADVAGMSVYHFCRAFKAATEYSPHVFVMQQRLKQAQKHLIDNRLSLAEIAYTCGFSSQSHFTNTFRGRLGTTPGKFRREAGH